MRVVGAEYPGEDRDALAQEWHRFLSLAFPDAAWIPIPNLGGAVDAFVREWRLEAVILTGGNDVGSAPTRDLTERRLIEWALNNGTPVFGVCRGLQMLQHYFGGRLSDCSAAEHVSTRHSVRLTHPDGTLHERMVNSFHQHGVRREDLATGLEPLAVTADGWVEGFSHRSLRAGAVQWHPERNPLPDPADVDLMRKALGFDDRIPERPVSDQDVAADPWLTPFTFPPCVH